MFRGCARTHRFAAVPPKPTYPRPSRVRACARVEGTTLATSAPASRARRGMNLANFRLAPPVRPPRFGLGFLELAALVEMGLVAEAHAEDRGRHAADEERDVEARLAVPGPGDGAEQEDADDRGDVAERLPVKARIMFDVILVHCLQEQP